MHKLVLSELNTAYIFSGKHSINGVLGSCIPCTLLVLVLF